MEVVGVVDNAVIQHRGVRAVHGWLETTQLYQYVCVFTFLKPYLFKVVYRYARLDLNNTPVPATGFLAEVVYGADAITAALPLPEIPLGLALLENFTPAGFIQCEEAVFSALRYAAARKVQAQ